MFESMRVGRVGVLCGVMALMVANVVVAQEEAIEARWNASLGVGAMKFEGDEELKDGFLLSGRIGYDFNEWWSFETTAIFAPELKENMRFDDATGQEVSRLEEAAGEGIHDVSAFGLAFDGLFHFTRWERLDPYLSIGGGLVRYSEKIGKNNNDLSLRAGGGVLYHFNDEWAVRGDVRTYFAGDNTEANAMLDAALVWTWGARVQPDIWAKGGPVDSDGDRLTDVREGELNTDPYDQDTDDDGLTDGEEVLDTETNPLEADTDWDMLKDGEEVLRYKTNPLERDTDRGGVSDGHEVLEDGTDPLNGDDDLQLFELYIQFDYDQAVIKPQYFPELDIIAKVMTRHGKATAVVEGHADRKKRSDPKYNEKLSLRRAQAVVDYLVKIGIEAKRLEAKGYGFSRPKAPNDLSAGNPLNRRVEVYIAGMEGGSVVTEVATDAPIEVAPAALEDPSSK